MVGWGESCCSDFVRCVRSSWLGFFTSSSFPGGSLPTRDELPWRSSYNSQRTEKERERERVAVIAACMLLCVTASIICSLNLRFG